MANDARVMLTGLWEAQDRNGNTFFRGRLGAARVLIFTNGYKQSDSDPDYRMYLVPAKQDDDQQGGGGGGGYGSRNPNNPPTHNPPPQQDLGDDDLPF